MNHDTTQPTTLGHGYGLPRPLDRRAFLRRSLLIGASMPVVVSLMAACGGEDDPTATAGTAPEPTSTTAAEPTGTAGLEPTQAVDDPTATTTAPSPTVSEPEATATSPEAGVNPRHMGVEIEPAGQIGGGLIQGVFSSLEAGYFASGEAWGITEPLLEINPETGEHVGLLAESWEVSDDATVWVASIRPDVTWHDGEPLTAEDVLFSYDGMWLKVLAGYFADQGLEPGGTEITADMEVQFTLTKGNVEFANLMLYSILAEHVIGELTQEEADNFYGSPPAFDSGSDPAMVVGTGPFRFKEFVTGDHITVERYDDYWDGQPHLDEVIFRAVTSQDALLTQLLSGDIDAGGMTLYAPNLSPEYAGDLADAGLEIADFLTGFTQLFALNLDPEKTALFQDEQVRQALLYAIDRETLVEAVTLGYGDVALGPISPAFGFTPDLITVRYDYDPEQAMALLGEAGWITAGDGTREKDGQPLAFTISTLSGDTLQESIAAVLQEYWRQVGVEAEILAEQDTAYFERYDSHDFEVVIQRFYGQLGSQAYQFTCAAYDQGGNRQRYCNAEADELLNAALAEPDREARLNLLAEFQNIIMTELPVGPLFYDRGIGAVNPRAHNLYPNALNPNFNMETWWIGLRPYSSVKAGRA